MTWSRRHWGATSVRRMLLTKSARRSRPTHRPAHATLRLLHRAVARGTTVRMRMEARFELAEVLRTEASDEASLRRALRCYRLVMLSPATRASLRKRARERVILMLCQRRDTDGGAAELLEEGGFVCRLSSACLAYDDPRRGPAGLAPARTMPAPRPPSGVAHATDAALPPGMLRQLQAAFAPRSSFWSEHGYRCGKSGFFSYVHRIDTPPRTDFDRALRALHAHACAHHPAARQARYCEWWAHCRPHGVGHQLHYDSDDEGRGGVRNPLVSSALYLTGSGVGGPTLVTEQRLGGALSRRGWATMPAVNRYLTFNGALLHGVVPGRGVARPDAAGAAGAAIDAIASAGGRARPPTRRITLMVAYWAHIRERPCETPAAARPFPYAAVAAAGGEAAAERWPALFDWGAERDGGASTAPDDAAPPDSQILWPVDPVWELARQPSDAGAAAAARSRLHSASGMPEYDACFQGLC